MKWQVWLKLWEQLTTIRVIKNILPGLLIFCFFLFFGGVGLMNWALANNHPPQRTADRTHASFPSSIQGFARTKKNRTWYELEFSMSPKKCHLCGACIWKFNQFKINTACCEPINLTTVTFSSLLLCFKSCFRPNDLWTYQYLLQLFIRDLNLVSRSWHINYFYY